MNTYQKPADQLHAEQAAYKQGLERIKNNHCPFCDSDDTNDNDPPDTEPGLKEAFQHIKCNTCEADWTEIYELDRWIP